VLQKAVRGRCLRHSFYPMRQAHPFIKSDDEPDVRLLREFGGLLSPSGVVAREYGLPAVLGVPKVMRLLQDGDEIEVDGARGVVRVR